MFLFSLLPTEPVCDAAIKPRANTRNYSDYLHTYSSVSLHLTQYECSLIASKCSVVLYLFQYACVAFKIFRKFLTEQGCFLFNELALKRHSTIFLGDQTTEKHKIFKDECRRPHPEKLFSYHTCKHRRSKHTRICNFVIMFRWWLDPKADRLKRYSLIGERLMKNKNNHILHPSPIPKELKNSLNGCRAELKGRQRRRKLKPSLPSIIMRNDHIPNFVSLPRFLTTWTESLKEERPKQMRWNSSIYQ